MRSKYSGWSAEAPLSARRGRALLLGNDDLVAALKSGRLFAAVLDVFSGEPRIDVRYYDLPNLFMLPHIGSSTIEARLAMGRAVIDGVIALLDGGSPGNRVVSEAAILTGWAQASVSAL